MDDEYEGNVEATGEDYSVEPAESRRPFRALLDVGLLRTTTGNRVFGALKGALDGGPDIPHSEKQFAGYSKDSKQPEVHHEYIYGGHVVAYMRTLIEDEPEKYQTHFSLYAKKGINADNIKEPYKKVHAAIRADPTVKKSEKQQPKEHKRLLREPAAERSERSGNDVRVVAVDPSILKTSQSFLRLSSSSHHFKEGYQTRPEPFITPSRSVLVNELITYPTFGNPSTRKRPGGGPAQGPYVARVMTGGGFIHLLVEKIDKMNRTKLPIRERIGSVLQLPIGIEVTVAEGSGAPKLEVQEHQHEDVLLQVGDQIVNPMEYPNEGPDEVQIENRMLFRKGLWLRRISWRILMRMKRGPLRNR
ncbi:hypothetical protein AgCh_019005 [Apium graveolens]